MDTVGNTSGHRSLRSNHLNAFYKAHPDIEEGSGRAVIATRAEKYGSSSRSRLYGGPLEFQLAPSNSAN